MTLISEFESDLQNNWEPKLILYDNVGTKLVPGNFVSIKKYPDSIPSGISAIEGFELPSSGTFTIQVFYERAQVWSEKNYGYYELQLSRVNVIPPISDGGLLTIGDTLAGEFTDTNHQDEWIFTAQSGEVLSIFMKRLTGNVVCDFEVLAPDGSSLGVANASANRIDAEIMGFEIPSSENTRSLRELFQNRKRDPIALV